MRDGARPTQGSHDIKVQFEQKSNYNQSSFQTDYLKKQVGLYLWLSLAGQMNLMTFGVTEVAQCCIMHKLRKSIHNGIVCHIKDS
jgi:hypothetical protein